LSQMILYWGFHKCCVSFCKQYSGTIWLKTETKFILAWIALKLCQMIDHVLLQLICKNRIKESFLTSKIFHFWCFSLRDDWRFAYKTQMRLYVGWIAHLLVIHSSSCMFSMNIGSIIKLRNHFFNVRLQIFINNQWNNQICPMKENV
jgi:hypothetical protein